MFQWKQLPQNGDAPLIYFPQDICYPSMITVPNLEGLLLVGSCSVCNAVQFPVFYYSLKNYSWVNWSGVSGQSPPVRLWGSSVALYANKVYVFGGILGKSFTSPAQRALYQLDLGMSGTIDMP